MTRPDPRTPYLSEGYDCPDCGGIFINGVCKSCGLTMQDLEDAADYFEVLEPPSFEDYYSLGI